MMFYNILPETVERPKRRLLFQWTHFLIRDNIAGDKDVYWKIVPIERNFFGGLMKQKQKETIPQVR